MLHDYDKFLRTSLDEMNFSTRELDEKTFLGNGGLDIDSLAASELAMRMNDAYTVSLPIEDVMNIPNMSYGELLELLSACVRNDQD